jgi:hypothetical protein
MKIQFVIFSIVGILVTGCASTGQLKSTSAGLIGCPTEEIEITNKKIGLATGSWEATCRGHKFLCSGGGGTMACKEELKSAK